MEWLGSLERLSIRPSRIARQPTKPTGQEVALGAKGKEGGKWDSRKPDVS